MPSHSDQLFETKRLQLVPFTLTLMRALLAGKDELSEQLGVEIPASWPGSDLADALPSFIARLEQAANDFAWDWLILQKKERVLIGGAGFMGGPKDGIAEIGYSIVPEYRNRGYATEAALYLIHWALQRRDILRVTARCLDDNVSSIKVLEKVGMHRLTPEGNILQWEARRERPGSGMEWK